MKAKTFLMALFVASLFLSARLIRFVAAELTVVRVPGDYPTIQEAINKAAAGSVVLVGSGTYHENLVINKTLMLLGEDRSSTIIDGDGEQRAVSVRAGNVVINGFTVQNGGRGVVLNYSDNCVISGNIVTRNTFEGIVLACSNESLIADNIVSFNGWSQPGLWVGQGITIGGSKDNLIDNNVILSNVVVGILVGESDHNIIQRNTMMGNGIGYDIDIHFSENNTICHNNFINTMYQIHLANSTYSNVSRNYWDDYVGLDDGTGGGIAGDGIGDTDLPWKFDDYPLVRPSQPISVVWENSAYPVSLKSNSTVSGFRFSQARKEIAFNITGVLNTVGYCNVTIPKTLLNGNPWTIKLDDNDITFKTAETENQTYSFIYFTYNHSTHCVQIVGTHVIPELNAYAILVIAMTCTLIVACAKRRRLHRINRLTIQLQA